MTVKNKNDRRGNFRSQFGKKLRRFLCKFAAKLNEMLDDACECIVGSYEAAEEFEEHANG